MDITPTSKIFLEGREFLVKRDDLFDRYLSGNKFRKLHTFLEKPSNSLHTIISYGGTQSNAMLAIAALCKKKSWKFIYYTKPMSQTQKEQSIGNYTLAMSLGMEHIEVQDTLYKQWVCSLDLSCDNMTYILHQGGADHGAKEGVFTLADEIRMSNCDVRAVATPSGTGTTALYLAQALPEYKIYTTPCIGDVAYLKLQMSALQKIPQNIVFLAPSKKYHFAKLYKAFLEIYTKTKESGIEFDLLYAPAMWLALLEQTDEKIMYIHSGGVSGNASMLARYKRANL